MITSFDAFIIFIVTSCAINGLTNGIIKYITKFLGFITSVVITYIIIYKRITIYFDSTVHIMIVSIITYIISLIIFNILIKKFLIKMIFIFSGNTIDKIFGIFSGIIIGSIISLITFNNIVLLNLINSSEKTNYRIAEIVDYKEVIIYPEWLKNSYSTKLFIKINTTIAQNIFLFKHKIINNSINNFL